MRRGERVDVPITASGFAHGVGLFETCAVIEGKVAFFDEHWARMEASAKTLGLPFDEDKTQVFKALRAFLDDAGEIDHTALKLILFEDSPGSTRLVWYLRRKRELKPEVSRRLTIATQRVDASSELCGHKTLNYWANRRGLEKAAAAGAIDAVVFNPAGMIAECWAANLFIVRGAELYTPPLADGPLPGIVREVLLREASQNGLAISEASLNLHDLLAADAVCVTNSLIGLQEITEIDLKEGAPWRAAQESHPSIEKARELFVAACAKSLLTFPPPGTGCATMTPAFPDFVPGQRTYLMGILNLTPDSFSDGGRYPTPEAALGRAVELVAEGADIIDLGGESTRPNSSAVSVEEELRRVIPVIEELRRLLPRLVLSIDTTKPRVAEEALKRGVHLLNDVHGLHGEGAALAQIAAQYDAGLIIMHNSRLSPIEGDPVKSMTAFFERALAIADKAGVSRSKMILDPGIGFGKEAAENWHLMGRLNELKSLGFPLLLGASRKRFLGEGLQIHEPTERDMATVGTTVVAIQQGIDLVRVHDVKSNRDAALVADRLYR